MLPLRTLIALVLLAVEVTFAVPASATDGVIFAGLVGESINDALRHLQSKLIPAR